MTTGHDRQKPTRNDSSRSRSRLLYQLPGYKKAGLRDRPALTGCRLLPWQIGRGAMATPYNNNIGSIQGFFKENVCMPTI